MIIRPNILTIIIATLIAAIQVSGQSVPDACSGNVVRYGTRGLPNSLFMWSVEGGEIINNYNDSVEIEWYADASNYQISVFEVSEHGCRGEMVSADITVYSPTQNIIQDGETCSGDIYEFDAGSGFTSYLWHDGSNNRFYVSGTGEEVWVEVTTEQGCTIRDSATLTIHNPPRINLGQDTALCDDDRLGLFAGNQGVSYLWSVREDETISNFTGNTLVVAEGEKTIWVQVTDVNGCVGSDTIQIFACTKDLRLGTIPNAFTPNEDGKNDTWIIEKIESYPDANVNIYDRWGRLVYSAENGYANDW
ncbi:MAG: gliding motility-associated C-terminal domain-containing protein, partial [Bacteroidota bacterium]